MSNDKKMSFEAFVAKAETVNSTELMEMITGGIEEDCHPGNPNCAPASLDPSAA